MEFLQKWVVAPRFSGLVFTPHDFILAMVGRGPSAKALQPLKNLVKFTKCGVIQGDLPGF